MLINKCINIDDSDDDDDNDNIAKMRRERVYIYDIYKEFKENPHLISYMICL